MERRGRKKKQSLDVETEVEKMIQERREFYEGLEEIEKLKKAFYEPLKTQNEEISKVDEMLTILTNVKDSHPGRKLFRKKCKFQCFTLDSLLAEFGKTDEDYAELILILQSKLLSNEILSDIDLSELFYFMSIENDELVCDSCHEILEQNITNWTPRLEDIFKILLNWGATFKTLELTDFEKSVIFPNYIYFNERTSNSISADFCSHNYEKIFSYLASVVSQTEKYLEKEKIILIKYALKVVLDVKCQPITNVVKNFIGACVNSIKHWDKFKIVTVSALIHDRNEHFHNQVAIIMDILPKISRCNAINSCLSLTVLRFIISGEIKYVFPYEDREILDLIGQIKVNPNNGEELYKLYMIIHLLNHIVYHRNLVEVNKAALEDLKSSVNSLKWEVAKSKRTFDADLLKGRISYCSTVWSLFSQRSTHSQHFTEKSV